MKKSLVTAALVAVGAFAVSAQADTAGKIDGKAEFEKHCAVCHPGGTNIVNKEKPLTREALKKNGVKSWKDIVGKMRNPGPGMTKFDKTEIPDNEAKAIAVYVMKTFK